MQPIKGILREELNNSLHMKESYERELSKLPIGSLVRKKIKDHYYYYLVSRVDGRVKFKYRGKASKEEIKKNKEVKALRAKYRNLLSRSKKQIKFLKGTLRGEKTI